MNIDLWVSGCLLAGCALFWLWASTRPLVDEFEDAEPAADPSAEPEREAVTEAEQPALARR